MKNYTIRTLILSLAVILILLSPGCTKREPDVSAIDRYNHGIAFLEQGKFKNAITEFEAALRADPTNFDALKNLAGAYAFDNNWESARDRYIQARDLRTNDKSIYVNLAYVFMHLQEFDLAWDNIRRAREIDPEYPLMHYRAGEIFRAQGDEAEAVAAFSEYLEREDNTTLADDARAIIASLGPLPSDVDSEISDSDEEVVEETPEPEVEEEVIEEEPEIEEVEEEVVEDEETEGEDVLEGLDENLEDQEIDEEGEDTESGEGEEGAEEDEEEGEEEIIIPDLPELTDDELYQDRLSRGRQMRAIGSTQAAIRLLTEAYEVHPDYALVNYELGMAYLTDGQNESARFYLERFIELGTDPELIAEVQVRLDIIGSTTVEEPDESDESSDETSDEDEGGSEEEDEEDEEDEEGNEVRDFAFF